MSELIKNRIENLKTLLKVKGFSARKLSLAAGHTENRVTNAISGHQAFSDDLAKTLEIALGVPLKTLDQTPSSLIDTKVAAEQDRVQAINEFLGEIRYANRYWNMRDLIEKSGIRNVDLSAKTGLAQLACSQVSSKKPLRVIHSDRARLIEDAFGLEPFALDQSHTRNTLMPPPNISQVSPEVIDFLGTGVYLNRYLNIKNFSLLNKVTYRQIDLIVGFKYRALYKLTDSPTSLIDNGSARAFEQHFGLEEGALDQLAPGFDYEAHQSSLVISESVVNSLKAGTPLFRYVNTRRILQERAITLSDFVPMMGRTKAFVYSILSYSNASNMGAVSARLIEQVLGIEPLSLDVPATFRVVSARPGQKLIQFLSSEAQRTALRQRRSREKHRLKAGIPSRDAL
jgi:transcriptional regulator with XRE-family HTH domain